MCSKPSLSSFVNFKENRMHFTESIKSFLPHWLKRVLKFFKYRAVGTFLKRPFHNRMHKMHMFEMQKLRKKQKIRVIFIAIHSSVWKVNSVYQEMLKDDFFEPVILVCPYSAYDEKRMFEELNQSLDFFAKSGCNVQSAYLERENDWLKLSSLEPDILFFTNPHGVTKSEYYTEAFQKYLSCYVPYHHEVVSYGDDQGQYNQYFHNAMWRTFVPHDVSKDKFSKFRSGKLSAVEVTGYPACETFIYERSKRIDSVWKQKEKIKIIWAPHHTIDNPNLPFANFLKYADKFVALVERKKSDVQWSFKPHPVLKSKLYQHSLWGKKRTDEFYAYWDTNEYTQLDEGEYQDLFKQSDAMIHDSGSFLAEYLYLQKPVMFMLATDNYIDYFNQFGEEALQACHLGSDWGQVEEFVESLINENTLIKDAHVAFLEKKIFPYYGSNSPAKRIVSSIKSAFIES